MDTETMSADPEDTAYCEECCRHGLPHAYYCSQWVRPHGPLVPIVAALRALADRLERLAQDSQ